MLLILAGGGWLLVGARDGRGGQEAWWSLLREYVLIPLELGLPLLVGVISGTALAADRRSGSVGQMMARGVTRRRWATSHLAASGLAASATVGGVVVVLALLIRTVGPSTGTSEVFAAVPAGFPAGGTGLAFTFGLFVALAAAFWASLSCLVGIMTKNLVAVICVPLLVGLVFSQAGNEFGGFGVEHLMTLSRLGPGPLPAAGIWIAGAVAATGGTLAIASHRETID
jgi:hypothetical protein